MIRAMSSYYFDRELNSHNIHLTELKKYEIVNKFLITQDWLFISPLFFQGFELDIFYNYCNKSGDFKQEINSVIFRKFFNLNWTASFIEGYCARCLYIQPFLKSIEHSLILTFQKDYEGGIKTLIPIIEGILRKYLNNEKALNTDQIGFKHIKQAIDFLKADLILNYKQRLLNYVDENNNKVSFEELQIEKLVKLQTQYYEIWFSFLSDFINNSFYLNTKGNVLTNEFNRHSILHEYGLKVSYNLENYIKVYFVLQFLTWIFLLKEKKSLLDGMESFRFFEKGYAYKNIILYSNKLIYEKHLLYKEHSDYDPEILLSDYPVLFDTYLPKKLLVKFKIFRKVEEYLWRKRLKK